MIVNNYEKLNWQNGITPLSDSNLNHMDSGISENRESIKYLNDVLGAMTADVIADLSNVKDYIAEAEESARKAKESAENAEAVVGIGIATTAKAGIVKPDGKSIKVSTDGTITSGSFTRAEVKEIGTLQTYEGGLGTEHIKGNTYQAGANGKNLLVPTLTSRTVSGVEITKNSDGTYKFVGTSTEAITVSIVGVTSIANGTYKFVGVPENSGIDRMQIQSSTNSVYGIDRGSGATINVTNSDYKVYLYINSGATVNAIVKPMLSADTSVTYSDYEPCISPSQPQPIHSVGDMGCLDLGTLEWTKEDTYWSASYSGADMKRPSSLTELLTLIHSTYKPRQATGISGVGIGTDYIALSTASATIYCTSTDKPSGLLLYEVADGQTAPQYGMAIKESNKNLLVPTLASTTNNGVTATRNSDGTYTLNGTATANAYLTIAQNISLKAGTYKLVCAENPSTSTYRCYINAPSEIASDTTNDGVFTLNEDKSCTFMFKVNSGESFSNTIIKPMISTDTTATYNSYVQHEEKTTIIPLSAPLRKIGDAYDYIDVKNGKIVRKIGDADLGTLSYGRTGSRFYSSGITDGNAPSSTVKANILCPTYTATTRTDVEKNDFSISFVHTNDGDYINLYDTSVSDASQLKTKLNGVLLYYELATPTEEALTDEQKSALAELVTYAGQTNVDAALGNTDAPPTIKVYYGESEVDALTLKNANDNIIIMNKLKKM